METGHGTPILGAERHRRNEEDSHVPEKARGPGFDRRGYDIRLATVIVLFSLLGPLKLADLWGVMCTAPYLAWRSDRDYSEAYRQSVIAFSPRAFTWSGTA